MKMMNREKLKESFRSKWINSSLTQETKNKLENIIEQIVDDLYNTNLLVVYPLTERHTYIFRKLNGLLDNGVCQTQRSVAKELGLTPTRIGQLVERIMGELISRRFIMLDSKTLALLKMSSADLSCVDEIKNIEIGTLSLKPQTIRKLRLLNVVTLQDLLTFSVQDLKFYFGDTTIGNIIRTVHSYGLKFIEELNFEEKSQIICGSTLEKVMNSSMSWIKMGNHSYNRITQYTNKYRKITLQDLIELIKNDNLQNAIGYYNPDATEIINQIKRIDFISISKEKPEFEDIEELLEKEISSFDLSSQRPANILRRNGVNKVKDLINKTRKQIKNMRGMGEQSYKEIITYFHCKGLIFADEREKIIARYSPISKEKPEFEDIEELLEKEISSFELSSQRPANILRRNGVNKVKDLINKTKKQIKNMRGMGEQSYKEIIAFFHGKGLVFADEREKIIAYSFTIQEQLEPISKAEELLAKYNALLVEKEQLQIRSKQLDGEINQVLAQLNQIQNGVQNGQPNK